MLKKVKELSAKELGMLIAFVNIPVGKDLMDTINQIIEVKYYKYSDLLQIAEENKKNNVFINVEKDFDQIMFEAYDIYYHLKDILKEAHKQYPDIEALTLMWDFVPLYERLLTTSKFELPSTKTIQKMYFENLLKEEIKKENYDYCAEIQKTIKSI